MPASMSRLWLTIVTTCYLKPTQIVHRVLMLFRTRLLHRSERYLERFVNAADGAHDFTPLRFTVIRPSSNKLADIKAGRFTFLNRSCELGVPTNWLPQGQTRLWIYNLHYFDYIRTILIAHQERPSEEFYMLFRRLADEWIDSCPIASSQAWDSYPLSLRLNNWLRAYDVFGAELSADIPFAKKLRQSIHTQAAFLEKHLEYHLLNNHLLENGRTLWFAGLFFHGSDADRWQKTGYRILMNGLEDSFLDDGAHDEISPMYHQIMLDMYLEIADVMESRGEPIPDLLPERLEGMRHWLSAVLHPDGEVSLFNDSAMGIAGNPTDFIGSGYGASDGLTALPDSGYFIFRDLSKKHFFMFDCGTLGPDHRNQHGHCDALSYELSIAGQRMIVDSGVNDYYGDIDSRNFLRGTRAHNTVVVDDTEQSEIWDRFRVARRARPKDVIWAENKRLMYVTAAHTGYERLPGKVTHRRWACFVERKFWIVCDRLEGEGVHEVESFLHFHPETTVNQEFGGTDSGQIGEVVRGDTALQVLAWGQREVKQYYGETSPLQGWYSEEFNADTSNTVWGLTHRVALPAWSGYVLWPESSDASLEFEAFNDSAKLIVKGSGTCYQLSFNPAGVELDIVG